MAVDRALCRAGHEHGSAIWLAAAVMGSSLLVAANTWAQTETPAASPQPVEILRGSVAPPAQRVERGVEPAVEPGAGPEARAAIAGERLWIVDEASGRLTGCRLINTLYVGGQAIRCTERPLPKGRPARD
jgi:hypothetical protein